MAERGLKLSNKKFWAILRKNGGLYARTARAIEKEFGIKMTRQSVRVRAERDPKLLQDILDESVDLAEEGLQDLMRSPLPNIRLKAIELYLKAKGAGRGFHSKDSVSHSGEVAVNVKFIDEADNS